MGITSKICLVCLGWGEHQRRQVQHQPLFRSAYSLDIPRFNLENRFSFTVQRTFSTVENCVSFIAVHPDSVPASGEITLTSMSSSGHIYRYMPSAIIETVECTQQIGCSCDFLYTITGNGAWQTTA